MNINQSSPVKSLIVGGALVIVGAVLVMFMPRTGGAAVKAQPPGPTAAKTGPAALPGIRWTEQQLKAAVAPLRSGPDLTPKHWPNGAKVAVCISFDIDNESPMLARDSLQLSPLSETEYGATTGLPRILALLARENLPASFYVPATSAILAPEMIPEIMKAGRHEIALHGWIHEPVVTLNDGAEEERLLKQAIDYLTKVTGKRPVGSRTGGWAFSPYTLEIERKLGLLYDSSLMGRDEPYDIYSDGKDSGILELPVEWIRDDAPYFGRTGALPSPRLIFEVYRDEFDVGYNEGGLVMLTMHPHVSGHRSRIVHLEKLIDYMKSKPGVWFATAEQIAQYVRKNGQTAQSSGGH